MNGTNVRYGCLREDPAAWSLPHTESTTGQSDHFGMLLMKNTKNICEKYSDIDKAAEIDVRLFWKVTKRRKPRRSRIYPEIRDEEGVTHIDPRGVAETFASFYRKLYTPLEDDSFDHVFRNTIIDKYRTDILRLNVKRIRGIYKGVNLRRQK